MAAIPAVPSTFPAKSASVAEYKSCTKLAHNKGRAKQATFFAMFPLVKSIVFTTPPFINHFFAVGALGEADGFHRRVCHWHFRGCSLGKTPEQLRCFGFAGLNPLRCLGFAGDTIRRGAPIPNRLGHFGTRVKARNPLRNLSSETPRRLQRQTSKRPDHFGTKVKEPSPFQLLESKARKFKTLNPNHRGKTRSSSAFSHRRFEGWQPRFQWDRIQQLPLHRAPGAYRPAPTQEPSRE